MVNNEVVESLKKEIVVNVVKTLRNNLGLTLKKAASIVRICENSWLRYEHGILSPKIQVIELFALKTKQNFESVVKEEIKKTLLSNNITCASGYVKGLEIKNFDFYDFDQFGKIKDVFKTKFSIKEISEVTRLNLDLIKKELNNEISILPKDLRDNLSFDYEFVDWDKFAFLADKYYIKGDFLK